MTSLEPSDTVSHETNAVETYVVVDVETTGLNPNHDRILTLGAVAVHYDGKIATINEDFFYVTINQQDWIEDTDWFYTIINPRSTLSWWVKQPEDVQEAAWRHTALHSVETVNEHNATKLLQDWIIYQRRLAGHNGQPIFTANPVSFDKPFVDQLFHSQGNPNPFDYRTLCLRSMAFGTKNREQWGTNIRNNQSLVPHHAFFDAYAQAHDLVDLLNDRDDSGYDDGLYWLHDPQLATHRQRITSIKGKGWYGDN